MYRAVSSGRWESKREVLRAAGSGEQAADEAAWVSHNGQLQGSCLHATWALLVHAFS